MLTKSKPKPLEGTLHISWSHYKKNMKKKEKEVIKVINEWFEKPVLKRYQVDLIMEIKKVLK